jgi:hypothetical protein
VLIFTIGIIIFAAPFFTLHDFQRRMGSHYEGLMFLTGFLIAEIAFNVLIDCMRSSFKPRALVFMFWINLFGAIIMLCVANTEFLSIFEHLKILFSSSFFLIEFCIAVTIGTVRQLFIFKMLADFGALPCVVALTAPRILWLGIAIIIDTYSASVIVRIVALVVVFGAFIVDVFYGTRRDEVERAKEVEGGDVGVQLTSGKFDA